MQPDVTAGAAAERLQLRHGRIDDAVVDVEFREARRITGAGAVHVGLAAIEADQVGLEPLEAFAPDLFAKRNDVVERAHRVDSAPFADTVGMTGAIGAAMR